MSVKKPILLPVIQPEPVDEEAWEESDPAVPHPDASADPEVEKQFLHSFAREVRADRQCCTEMETQLGFSRTAPVILHDGKNYWLPVPSGSTGVLPGVGVQVIHCPWCGKRLVAGKEQSAGKKAKGGGGTAPKKNQNFRGANHNRRRGR